MSVTQEEQVAELEALDHLLTAAQEMHEHQQLDRWRLGDEAVRYVRSRRPELFDEDERRLHPHTKTGLWDVLDEAASKVEEVAPEIDRSTFRFSYSTAKAWPDDERLPESASFGAHQALNSRRFDGKRGTILRALVRESRRDYVTVKVARLKASETAPRPKAKTPLEKTETALLSALHRLWNPTDRVGPDDRKGIGLILRQIAAKVESGEPF